jgi:hypothetical protein
VSFKPPHEKLKFKRGGKEINKSNLTVEVYEKLVERNPSYADLFIVQHAAPKEKDTKKISQ